jgi:hypothetical protein
MTVRTRMGAPRPQGSEGRVVSAAVALFDYEDLDTRATASLVWLRSNVSEETARHVIRDRKIDAHKFGRAYLVTFRAVLAFERSGWG